MHEGHRLCLRGISRKVSLLAQSIANPIQSNDGDDITSKKNNFSSKIYLPTGIGVAIVEEVLIDPFVDGRQSHLVFVGFHGHANERSVRVRRFDIAHRFV